MLVVLYSYPSPRVLCLCLADLVKPLKNPVEKEGRVPAILEGRVELVGDASNAEYRMSGGLLALMTTVEQ